MNDLAAFFFVDSGDMSDIDVLGELLIQIIIEFIHRRKRLTIAIIDLMNSNKFYSPISINRFG